MTPSPPPLLRQLHALVDAGNTVITVEHDMRMIAASDWVIDMGPGAGSAGGEIVVAERQRTWHVQKPA